MCLILHSSNDMFSQIQLKDSTLLGKIMDYYFHLKFQNHGNRQDHG